MRKGIHTTVQKRRSPRGRLALFLPVAGVLLIWTASLGFAQESETPATPEPATETAPVEPPAEQGVTPAEPALEPAPAMDESARWEQQIEELTQHRRELEEAADNVERELRESAQQYEERQRQLREELEELRSQIRDIAARTFELRREQLRREYQRELEALERSYRPPEATEPMRRPPFGPERPEPWRQEMAENVKGIRGELREIQEQRERDANRWRELHEHLRGMAERIEALTHRTEKTQQAIDQGRAERQALTERQEGSTRQHEELRAQVHQIAEQQRGLKERAEAVSGEFRQQIDRLCTDMQRMGQTVGRVEQDRIRAEDGLRAQVADLDNHVRALQIEQARTQGALNMLLSQGDRSTVGSAGRTWGW